MRRDRLGSVSRSLPVGLHMPGAGLRQRRDRERRGMRGPQLFFDLRLRRPGRSRCVPVLRRGRSLLQRLSASLLRRKRVPRLRAARVHVRSVLLPPRRRRMRCSSGLLRRSELRGERMSVTSTLASWRSICSIPPRTRSGREHQWCGSSRPRARRDSEWRGSPSAQRQERRFAGPDSTPPSRGPYGSPAESPR